MLWVERIINTNKFNTPFDKFTFLNKELSIPKYQLNNDVSQVNLK